MAHLKSVAFGEAPGLRWQNAAATPLSHALNVNAPMKPFVRTKAAWRFTSRRSPRHLVRLCVLCVFALIRVVIFSLRSARDA
jgi:hypothetical protein